MQANRDKHENRIRLSSGLIKVDCLSTLVTKYIHSEESVHSSPFD